jgi:arsenate reductase
VSSPTGSTACRAAANWSCSGRGPLIAGLTVYEKRSCSTCRRLFELLTERGVDFERVQYHVEGIDEPRIRELLAKAGISAREALREREPLVAQLGLAREDISDDELIGLMAEHPQLLQRPIVERGDRAVLARPVERVLLLLDG